MSEIHLIEKINAIHLNEELMIIVAQSDDHSFKIALKQGKLHLISTNPLVMLDVAQ